MERYLRQELFSEIGKNGQKKISMAKVAVVGVGALGSVSSELLARSGIGRLTLFDADKVEESNLQRQSLFTEKDVGKYKVEAAKSHLEMINSEIEVHGRTEMITAGNIDNLESDIIIDGTDNMETRFLLNEYAKKKNIPFIYGSGAGSIGIVYTILESGACLNCILKNAKNFATCQSDGIINPATHIVGSLQACEALKIILGKDPSREIIRFDVWKGSFDRIKVKRDEKCHVCNRNYPLLEKKNEDDFLISECKTKSAYTAKPKKRMKLDMRNITRHFQTIEDGGIIAVIKINGEEIIVHDYGELLFKTLKDVDKIRGLASEIYKQGGISK